MLKSTFPIIVGLGLFLKDCERLKDVVLSSEIIKKKVMRFTAVSKKDMNTVWDLEKRQGWDFFFFLWSVEMLRNSPI
jgi:hypothetical protein